MTIPSTKKVVMMALVSLCLSTCAPALYADDVLSASVTKEECLKKCAALMIINKQLKNQVEEQEKTISWQKKVMYGGGTVLGVGAVAALVCFVSIASSIGDSLGRGFGYR